MKKKNLIIAGTAAFAVCATIGAALLSVNLASAKTGKIGFNRKFEHSGEMRGKTLTDEQKAELQTKREEQMQKMRTKQAAVEEAIKNSDYSAWVAAVGENFPMLEKINQDNFSKFVEAHTKMQEARQIMKDLGVNEMGFGEGGFQHFGRGPKGIQQQKQ